MNIQTINTQTYAELVNSQFNKSTSHYVSIETRLKDTIGNNVYMNRFLDQTMANFSLNNLGKQWEDFKFCKTAYTTVSRLAIDTTLQRFLILTHCADIINNFKQIMVMPISVYEDANNPGKFVCWDGQHTAVSLYMIASMLYGKTMDEIEVPIVVYDSSLKSEMRESFITLNSTGKLPLDLIDIYQQKVFGVRTDGSTNSEWILTEQKQQALEQNLIFATHEKFGDANQPGAFSRLVELVNNNYPLEVTQNFAKYFFSVCNSNRPVEPKESLFMYEFFNLCIKQRIKVDDAYIAGVAASLSKAFKNKFSCLALYDRAVRSYEEWFRKNKPNPDGTILGINRNERNIGMVFLIEQIRKNFDGKLPEWPNKNWSVPKRDLF